ncbi:Anthranilate phosphoribosyltransferase [BD1-7 clade bacterium]|uniref:Anthranilate phosphoribosyltransferase n=1 Tax=BD1-7 clade bacterium TaxID=2029982 RepID=A0A5S9QQ20_9GAMM|nr:Anthranilate phosphoribosyltransferase [BD1-7 clade bacterium]CAA0121360.1 Anthranilate phosphoribosyltransferase [BD1-7 clade bacterium]
MKIQHAINQVLNHQNLTSQEMHDAMQEIMTGQATDAQIGGFLAALRMKGESVEEIAAAAGVMRSLSAKVDVAGETLDIVGTGGDGASIFNVSTASAFIAAAAGACVAKHGNRSVTSTSGSADLLIAAGADLDISPQQVAKTIEATGVGFMFAVKHHGAMKHAIGPRRELAARTIFNILGPLTNPAGSRHLVVGVFDGKLVEPLAQVLRKLGAKHVLVVHADDGLDEFSIATTSTVAELKDDKITTYTVAPEDFGLERGALEELRVDSAEASLALVKDALGGIESTASRMLALNAGAAIYAADVTCTLAQGVEMAQDVMASGQAKEKFNEFIQFTRGLGAAE